MIAQLIVNLAWIGAGAAVAVGVISFVTSGILGTLEDR